MALVALGCYNMTAPLGPSCVMPLPMPPAGQRGRAERKRLMTSLKEARSLEDFCERVGRSTGICRRTQDQRRANRYPYTGRKLLSQSREGPWLEVSDRPAPGGLTTLDCKACGFSTRDITLVWLRDGEPRPQDTRQEAVVLNGNGTYQTGATIDIDPSPGDKYTCHVQHASLPGGLSMDWEPKSNAQPSVGVSVWLIVGVGLLVAGTLL